MVGQKQCNAKMRGGKTDCKSMAHHAQEGHFPRSGQLTFEGCCTKAPIPWRVPMMHAQSAHTFLTIPISTVMESLENGI